MRRLACLVVLVLGVTGCCRRPLHVITTSKLCSSLLPVKISSDGFPVRVDSVAPFQVEATLPIKDGSPLVEMVVDRGGPDAGKIALIDVDGILLNKNTTGPFSAGENPVSSFREKLDAIAADPSYQAVLIRINSPGGGVTATDIMHQELLRFKQETKLPIVACLMDVGAGGAYYIATAADQIVAHPTSITGGLGVILNLYNLEDALNMFNILGVSIRAGQNTDLGSPLRAMPPESREILQQIADDFHQRLQAHIRQSRPLKIVAEDTEAVFDGRVFTSRKALELGLVDVVGYLDDAKAICQRIAGADQLTTVILHRRRDAANTPYDITPHTPLQKDLLPHIAGFNRSTLPTFMYIWQPDPALETSAGG